MPTVTIAGRAVTYAAAPARPKMTLRSAEGGSVITIPFAPVEIDHDGYGWDWQTVERSGRLPLLLRASRNPRTISFRLTIANQGGSIEQSVDPLLKRLAQLADSGDAVTIAYTRAEGGRWRLLSMPYTVTARRSADNAPSRADMTLTFQWASDVPRQIGRTPPKKPAKRSTSKGSTSAKSTVKTYTIKRGDTLYAIARKVYGDGNRWPTIARANGIKNANRLVVGKKLKIP